VPEESQSCSRKRRAIVRQLKKKVGGVGEERRMKMLSDMRESKEQNRFSRDVLKIESVVRKDRENKEPSGSMPIGEKFG